MIISTQQILYYFIFILCISAITLCYIKCSSNNEYFSSKTNEKFENTNNGEYFSEFTDSEINDSSLKNSINNQLISLKPIIDKYSIIDPSININNKNVLCDNTSFCEIDNNSSTNETTCLFDNVSTSCSKYFDEYVKTQVNINLSSLGTRENILVKLSHLNSNIQSQSSEIDFILDSYIYNLNIEDQQNTFINYNIINLDDKTKLLDKTTKDFEKNENDINVNQVNFTNFLSKNNNNINKINFYYKIIIGIIIIIIITGIINLFMTKYD